MKLRHVFAAGVASVVVSALAGAVPAYATDVATKIQGRNNGRCLATSGLNSSTIIPVDCSYPQNRWTYEPRGTSPSNHVLVKFQSLSNNGCLDTNGGGPGSTVLTIACNTGFNQFWEVFATTSGGHTYYTYKSWGAWKYQGQHLCLRDDNFTHEGRLDVCDTTLYDQDWLRLSA